MGHLCHRAVTTPRIAPLAIRICFAWTTAHGLAFSNNRKQAAASALPLIRLEKIISVALVISYHQVEQWTFQRILVKSRRKIDFSIRDFMIFFVKSRVVIRVWSPTLIKSVPRGVANCDSVFSIVSSGHLSTPCCKRG
jgi:hypothetical protein